MTSKTVPLITQEIDGQLHMITYRVKGTILEKKW